MLAVRPERRANGAHRVDLPVVGTVRQLDPLALAGEDDGVVAHHIAAAQDGEADVAALRDREAVADTGRHGIRIDTAPGCRGTAQAHEVPDGASTLWRWCISRISMSKSGPRVSGDLLDQSHQQVDAQAHIGSVDDRRVLRGALDRLGLRRFQPWCR